MTNDQKKIESIFKELGDAVQAHPFNFLKENDITCFLHQRFSVAFPERIRVKIDPDIEHLSTFDDPEKVKFSRVYTEIKFPNDGRSVDLALLENRSHEIYSKNQNMIGGINPPFLSAIEIKLANGSKTKQFGDKRVPSDIKKLSSLSSQINLPYVVLVDCFENRPENEIEKLQAAIDLSKNVKCVYASIDSFEILKSKNY